MECRRRLKTNLQEALLTEQQLVSLKDRFLGQPGHCLRISAELQKLLVCPPQLWRADCGQGLEVSRGEYRCNMKNFRTTQTEAGCLIGGWGVEVAVSSSSLAACKKRRTSFCRLN